MIGVPQFLINQKGQVAEVVARVSPVVAVAVVTAAIATVEVDPLA